MRENNQEPSMLQQKIPIICVGISILSSTASLINYFRNGNQLTTFYAANVGLISAIAAACTRRENQSSNQIAPAEQDIESIVDRNSQENDGQWRDIVASSRSEDMTPNRA